MQKHLYSKVDLRKKKKKRVVPFPLLAQFKIFVCLIRSWHITQSWIQLIVKAGRFLPIFNFWDGFLSVLLNGGLYPLNSLLWRCAQSEGTSDDEGMQLLNEKNQDSDQGIISPSSMTLLNTLIIQSTYAEKPEKGNITGSLFSFS